jgi:hypothetical protein
MLEKHHLYFGEIEIPERLFNASAQVRYDQKIRSAIHVYTLVVKKQGCEFEYASIAEIHHPEFLQIDELVKIYGPLFPGSGDDRDRLHGFLEVVESRINTLGAMKVAAG